MFMFVGCVIWCGQDMNSKFYRGFQCEMELSRMGTLEAGKKQSPIVFFM